MASIPFFVRNAKKLIRGSYRVLGKSLTEAFLRETFFGHFCGGTDLESVAPTVRKLESMGVGSILDYAAEKDLGAAASGRKEGVMSARTFEYESEAQCDANAAVFRKCIDHVAAASPDAFAAIKVTALGRPELLQRISETIFHVRRTFKNALAGKEEKRPETGPLGQYRDAGITEQQLIKWLETHGVKDASKIVKEAWKSIDVSGDNVASYEEWMNFLHPSNAWARNLFVGGEKPLSDTEIREFDAMLRRVEQLGAYAAQKRVRLMIDAEQTYFQPAIDLLVRDLQRRHNREFPSVYNTYQCYLRDVQSRVQSDLRVAQAEGWIFAAKIVRGAYMVQERTLASQQGIASPVWQNIQETHASYHAVADILLNSPGKVAAMFATHNEDTVGRIIESMNTKQVDRSRFAFGQLLGMCDHVSMTLGAQGYKVYKYVPYGPIEEVVPYLVRRAEENSTLLGSPGVQKERKLVWEELRKRLKEKDVLRTMFKELVGRIKGKQ